MGILTDFIIADRSEAEAINKVSGMHLKKWTCLEGKSMDQVKLTSLWGVLTDANEFDMKFCQKGIALLHQSSEEGPWVYLMPKKFLDKLLAVPDKDHKKLAQTWAKCDIFKYDRWTKADIWQYFQELVAFVRQAKEAKSDLLLWVSV